jgi:predicted dinucleotide-binding enzyme
VASHLSSSIVVKAFNTINWRHLLVEPAPPGPDRRAIPMAGDDADSKSLVARLADDMGYDSVDIGSLSAGWMLQPGEEMYGPKLSVAEVEAVVARLESRQ